MTPKRNGEQQLPQALGNSAPEGLNFGDVLSVDRACDRWLRKRGLIATKFNGYGMTREQQGSSSRQDAATSTRDVCATRRGKRR